MPITKQKLLGSLVAVTHWAFLEDALQFATIAIANELKIPRTEGRTNNSF
jgi:hypothetical protein